MYAKKIYVFLTAALVSLGLIFALGLQTAEAKRIGGGSSFGQQKQSFSRQATPPSAAPTNTARTAAPAASGASRWLGPLAGLAAGGLLAAMFFGGAFDSLKPMDFILIALLAFGAFWLIRALRNSGRSTSSPYARTAATAGGAPAPAGDHPASNAFPASAASAPASLSEAPAWFNEDSFLQGAKQHFTNLQNAWDANDLKTMQEYFTPELFLELARERARIGNENNVTDVQSLNAQLLDVSREGEFVVASVLFQGMVRENYGQPEPIAEIWHVRHTAESAQGDWLITGIQQYNHAIH